MSEKHFLKSNKEYCLLVYELTGVWIERAQYTEDNSCYVFYYNEKNFFKIKNNLDRIEKAVKKQEGAKVLWDEEAGCLTLYFEENDRKKEKK